MPNFIYGFLLGPFQSTVTDRWSEKAPIWAPMALFGKQGTIAVGRPGLKAMAEGLATPDPHALQLGRE